MVTWLWLLLLKYAAWVVALAGLSKQQDECSNDVACAKRYVGNCACASGRPDVRCGKIFRFDW